MRCHLDEKFNLTFEVLNIKYRNNFFAIAEVKILKLDSKDILPKKMVIKGNFSSIYKGNVYDAEVSIREHLRFGFYLQLLNIPKEKISNSESGLTKFLKSHTKSISTNDAKLVINTLGIDLIDKIKNNPGEIDNIELSKKKKDAIKKSVINHWYFEKLLMFLQMNNISSDIANLIYDKFEDNCFNILYKTPYRLNEIKGLNFTIIDNIVKNNKIIYKEEDRCKSIIIDIMNQFVDNLGYTCCLKNGLYDNVLKYIDKYAIMRDKSKYTFNFVQECLSDLVKKQVIIIENYNDNEYLYLQRMLTNENDLATRINDLNTKLEVGEKIAPLSVLNNYITNYEKSTGLILADKQKRAIEMVFLNKISILTGGPGTGKTHTVNTILQAVKALNPSIKISLMAPTGKAANRMSELTNEEATTIHRAIKLNGFDLKKETEIIESDFIIIDECSMIDSYLFEQLLLNVKEEAKILFVGDVDQLPSVGAGNVLKNLIDSCTIPVIKLDEIFRQSLNSKIITNSHKLIKGFLSNQLELNDKNSDFHFREEVEPNKILDIVENTYEWLLNTKKCSVEDICVLAPMKDSTLGVLNLNRIIQNKINKNSNPNKEFYLNDIDVLKINDRVMQTVNNYQLDVMNGEVGIISDIYENKTTGLKEVLVSYKNKEDIVYTITSVRELTLAYACSIHKMQGSEVPYIIHIIHDSHHAMLSRNLVYTAWTRAKKELFVIGQEDALNKAIINTSTMKRQSLLKEKIIEKTNIN